MYWSITHDTSRTLTISVNVELALLDVPLAKWAFLHVRHGGDFVFLYIRNKGLQDEQVAVSYVAQNSVRQCCQSLLPFVGMELIVCPCFVPAFAGQLGGPFCCHNVTPSLLSCPLLAGRLI